tara:strand:- start:10443 stop:10664 length:222 start_codon:yes stop_codon:yes gene_type:complete
MKEKNSNNIIHEWNIIDTPSREEIIKEEYNHCSLCGEELMFTHNTDFRFLKVEEEAECMSCGVRHKKDHHILQ